MNSLVYLIKFLYRIRFWIIVCPILVAMAVFFAVDSKSRVYKVDTTIYTGVVSGFNLETIDSERPDWASINNAMDNLVNIMLSQTTLRNVSMRLYAQHMMFGDPNKDNNYITAANYRALLRSTPLDVLALIDKTSEENTLKNLYDYEKANSRNYVYGLFNWTHRHYSYESLRKILVKRMGNSDMLNVSYATDDPGIAYYTLVLLNEEFVKYYGELRFGETNNVIKYFEEELKRVGGELRDTEDSLTRYNVDRRVINYDKQTEFVASMGRDYELRYEDIRLAYTSSQALMNSLEERIGEHVKLLRRNADFVNKMNEITNLTSVVTVGDAFNDKGRSGSDSTISVSRKQLSQAERDIVDIARDLTSRQVSTEGVSSNTLVDQWLAEVIRFSKAKAELGVMNERKEEIDSRYDFFSPIGSTIKRKEREIDFLAQSYLSVLASLNAAKLRYKNLQMTSATLKVISPPTFPIASMPLNRRYYVAVAFFGTMILLFSIFLLLEFLDRTLRDVQRAERITKTKVYGAYPLTPKLRYRSYVKDWEDAAIRYLGNTLLSDHVGGRQTVVSLLSIEKYEGKSRVAEQLADYCRSCGVSTRIITSGIDFTPDSKEFRSAQNVNDIYMLKPGEQFADLIIVEYPSLKESSVPQTLLCGSDINLVVSRANRVWKDVDNIILTQVKNTVGESKVFVYLTYAERLVVETFTGLLPPFTFMRKWTYKIYQMGFTSKDNVNA